MSRCSYDNCCYYADFNVMTNTSAFLMINYQRSVCQYVTLWQEQRSLCLFLYLSVYLSTYLSIYLPIYLPICHSLRFRSLSLHNSTWSMDIFYKSQIRSWFLWYPSCFPLILSLFFTSFAPSLIQQVQHICFYLQIDFYSSRKPHYSVMN